MATRIIALKRKCCNLEDAIITQLLVFVGESILCRLLSFKRRRSSNTILRVIVDCSAATKNGILRFQNEIRCYDDLDSVDDH
mmetsp:Transcript_29440/g.62503  ORF Transcript_29440/g.62503 Transcript_29440/m.62503 type:complete len:82 (+) Transcript_29440:1089-1334(+)